MYLPVQMFRILCAAIILASLMAMGCKADIDSRDIPPSTLETIKKQKKITVGWAPYAPYSSINLETGETTGFYVDLVNRVADEANLEVKWVETTWGTMIADLLMGKFDVMGSPTFRTIPRALEVAFTRPIDYFGYSAIVRAGEERFKTVIDFNHPDVKIAVTQGEVGHEFAKRHLPEAQLVVHKTGNISLALVDVIQGKADVGIADAWTIKQFTKKHDAVTDLFGHAPFNRVGAGWFVSQDDGTLLTFLNASIDWLEASDAIDEIASKYELPSFR